MKEEESLNYNYSCAVNTPEQSMQDASWKESGSINGDSNPTDVLNPHNQRSESNISSYQSVGIQIQHLDIQEESITLKAQLGNSMNEESSHLYKTKEIRSKYELFLRSPISEAEAKELNRTLIAKEKKEFGVKRKRWCEEELKLLFFGISYLINSYGRHPKKIEKSDWKFISNLIPERTTEQCTQKWRSITRTKSVKDSWLEPETSILRSIIQKNGTSSWAIISTEMRNQGLNRNSKQCREKWMYSLKPEIKRSGWAKEEDIQIVMTVLTQGKRWATLAKQMPTRSEGHIKNRYLTLIKNEKKRAPYRIRQLFKW